jgi:hypothetical protein
MSLFDTILADRAPQTDAERRAYTKVCDDLRAEFQSELMDADTLEHEAWIAEHRRRMTPNLRFPKTYSSLLLYPMRFETAEEMDAYIDVRERAVRKLREAVSLIGRVFADTDPQTDAQGRAYCKVCIALRRRVLKGEVLDSSLLDHEARMAALRRKIVPGLLFPAEFPACCVYPMRFETAEEMDAYIDVRKRVVSKLR